MQAEADSGSAEISIESWIELEIARLSEFREFWLKGALGRDLSAPAGAFPALMADGEWDENYRSWGGA